MASAGSGRIRPARPRVRVRVRVRAIVTATSLIPTVAAAASRCWPAGRHGVHREGVGAGGLVDVDVGEVLVAAGLDVLSRDTLFTGLR